MKWFVALLLVSILVIPASANDSLNLSTEHWKSITEGVDYSEDVEPKEPEKASSFDEIAPLETSDPYDFDSVRTVVFATLIAIAILVLVFIIKNAKAPATFSSPKIQASTLDEAEENLPDVELNNLLEEATSNGHWKVALRIQFLMLLQEMIYAELIIWKKRKTNQQYVDELRDPTIQSKFGKTVNVFDPVWYGGNALQEAEYHSINRVIEELKVNVQDGE